MSNIHLQAVAAITYARVLLYLGISPHTFDKYAHTELLEARKEEGSITGIETCRAEELVNAATQ